MTIKFYSCEGSRGIRPIWTAEEMGLDYEVEMLPFPPRFLHKEYLDINILGTVPYMIDGDLEMTESVGMSQYLVDVYGPSELKVEKDESDYGEYWENIEQQRVFRANTLETAFTIRHL